MKKSYQYNEILKVHRVLEEIEKFLSQVDDDKHKTRKKCVKRQIESLRTALEISSLKEVINELKKEKKKEAGNDAFKVYLTSTEIYEASRKDDEQQKKVKMLLSDLEKKVLESDVLNE